MLRTTGASVLLVRVIADWMLVIDIAGPGELGAILGRAAAVDIAAMLADSSRRPG